jgi:hypothetical protein
MVNIGRFIKETRITGLRNVRRSMLDTGRLGGDAGSSGMGKEIQEVLEWVRKYREF